MPYTASTLVCVSSTPGLPAKFLYQSPDSAATVAGSGYFNSGTERLRQNDLIEHQNIAGATLRVVQVTSTTGAAVVTTGALAFT